MIKKIRILFVDESPTVHLQFRDLMNGVELTKLNELKPPLVNSKPSLEIDSIFDIWLAQKLVRKHQENNMRYTACVLNIEEFDLHNLEMIRQIREIDPEMFIVIFGHKNKQLRKEIANYLGFDQHLAFLDKPLNTAEGLILMHFIIYQWMINYKLKQRFRHQIFGDGSMFTTSTLNPQLQEFNNYQQFLDKLNLMLSNAFNTHTNVGVIILDADSFDFKDHISAAFLRRTLLAEIGNRIRKKVDESCLYGYLIGEKFAIAYPNVMDEASFYNNIVDLQLYLSEPYVVAEEEINITFSIGVSLSFGNITDPEELISYSESALYSSRQRSRGAIVFYRQQFQEKLVRSLTMEVALKRALENEEFCLYYQPLFDLKTQFATGVEALLRWNHPDFGILSPKDFLYIAEETDLIAPLGSWVFEEACRQLHVWNNKSGLDLTMAINLSPNQFLNSNLSKFFNEITSRYKIDPKKIELEITEQQYLENTDIVKEQISELYEAGYNLVIDDFGVGYSSLQYLNILPVNKIKIDRSFIMKDTEKYKSMLKAIMILANQMKLKTLCEGVETAQQFALLQKLGCNEIQGFLFCPPIMATDIPAFVSINTNQRLLIDLLR